jgi:uncharacterized membrane protein YeiH
VEDLAYWIGMAAVAVSAITGVIEAGRQPIDWFGVVLIALTAGLGGGTLRDLVLDREVFWVHDQRFLAVAIVAGLATVPLVQWVRLPARAFLFPDAIALALFTIAGTQIALARDVPWLAATFLGVMTGVFGGVLRDVLANERPLIFAGQLYGTVSWLGAIVFVALLAGDVPAGWASLGGMAVVVALRLAAIRFDLRLPTFSARR